MLYMTSQSSESVEGSGREKNGFNRFNPDTIDGNPKDMSFDQITAHTTYKKTKQVLNQFQNIDYPASISDNLDLDEATVRYHIEKLQYLGLVKLYWRRSDRTLYKITKDGENVLENLNI